MMNILMEYSNGIDMNKRLGGTECRQGLPAREAVEGGAPTGSCREATEG